MSEHDAPDPVQETSAGPEEPPTPNPVRHRRRWPWVLTAALLTPVVLLVLWIEITLHYSYSSGTRPGYVQKFSKKGWLCKTWEGQLAQVNYPGSMQERWDFSVRSDSIANVIIQSEGKRVMLSYDQHKGVPTSCFGETEYFVTGVRVIGD